MTNTQRIAALEQQTAVGTQMLKIIEADIKEIRTCLTKLVDKERSFTTRLLIAIIMIMGTAIVALSIQ